MRTVTLILSVFCLATCLPGCGPDAARPPVAPPKPGASKGNTTPKLVMVSLYQDKVTLSELAEREDPAAINWLDAGHSNLTDADLGSLSKFSGLQKLNLDVNSDITDEGLKHLKGLHELRDLSLFYCPQLTGAGFVQLEDLVNLTTLKIGNNKNITDDNLKHLQKLKGLRTLSAFPLWGITDEGLKNLSQIRELQHLTIASKKITDEGLLFLVALKHLESLHLNPGAIDESQLTSDGIEKLKQALPGCKIYHANER